MIKEPNREWDDFNEHADNALEKIHGKHINNIQDAINELQLDNIEVHERVFLNESLFVLEHNPYVNYMHYVDLSDGDQVFRAMSSNWEINTKKKSSQIANNQQLGVIHTVALKSEFSELVNSIILKADEEIPRGSAIRYYVSNDLQNYFPIKLSASLPFKFDSYNENIYLKIELIANAKRETPNLYAVALFCSDKSLEAESVLITPDLIPSDNEPTSLGDLLLHYDDEDTLLDLQKEDGSKKWDLIYDLNGDIDSVIETGLFTKKTTKLFKDIKGRVNIIRTTEEDI